jgi:hypothetical protein
MTQISFQLVSGTFYGEPVTWIHESHDGALVRQYGPYWSHESAQAQINSWTTL